tara:strand:- start:368 stop:580 length:213 start_codon:yes stop_codon:yes gene_type:complete
MPCGCKVERTTEKRIILRNPKNGKKITEFLVKNIVVTSKNLRRNFLPGFRRISCETSKNVWKPRLQKLRI